MTGLRVLPLHDNGENYLAASHYGPRSIEDTLPSGYVQQQGDKVQIVPFTFDSLPVANANDDAILIIPALSYIVSATLTVIVAGAAGTSYEIGLNGADGSTVDDNGLFNTTELAVANLTPAGEVIVGAAGAQLGTSVAVDTVVEVAATGTFTAGEYVLEVVYRTPDNRVST